MATPYTKLSESSTDALATPIVPAGFDATMANLLGQACLAAYAQYGDAGAPVGLSGLPPANGATQYVQLGSAFTQVEAIGTAGTSQDPVNNPSAGYVTVPYGFAFAAQDAGGHTQFNVIVFRGTRSYQEWIFDATALPGDFTIVSNFPHVFHAQAHAGFYEVYNAGGQNPPAAGTLADQVHTVLAGADFDSSVPLYITGHSLGGALAELCATHVGHEYSGSFSQLYAYSLASPLAAVGVTTPYSAMQIPTSYFTNLYQKAVSSGGGYRVVNAADVVPVLPFSPGTPTGWGLEFVPAVSTANTVSFLCQPVNTLGTGNVLANHDCGLYAEYLGDLVGVV